MRRFCCIERVKSLHFEENGWYKLLTNKEQNILSRLEALAKEHDVEIVTIETVGSKKAPIIRIYIDTDNGVSFSELSEAQSWIGDEIEAIDPYPGAYTLEISSPGIDRPLRTLEHFKRFIGQVARVRMCEPVEGSMNFKGVIESVDEGDVCLKREDGASFRLPISGIKRANLVGNVEF